MTTPSVYLMSQPTQMTHCCPLRSAVRLPLTPQSTRSTMSCTLAQRCGKLTLTEMLVGWLDSKAQRSALQSSAPVEGGAALQEAAAAAIAAATGAVAAVAAAVSAAPAEHAAPGGRAPAAPVPDELWLLLHHLQLHMPDSL